MNWRVALYEAKSLLEAALPPEAGGGQPRQEAEDVRLGQSPSVMKMGFRVKRMSG